ncbi:hypothetical protein BDA96_10G207800 [Sorghum bicolor]|uniref:X8 domain-containing protein n=1 Tax=Sorghum bicolor TaxID=4558 RepID=A0A921Q5L8_SORBI|nr:hypothetical protein BDA96_10G207800 [Sorghum bicolor]
MLAASLLALRLLLLVGTAAAGAVGMSGGGQLWCVAKNNAEDGALQSAIDWACSVDGGRADCAAIQQGGACFDPPDLQQHASYAFNDYFLRSGGAASPAACDFSGAAALTALNPSHGSCVFPSRGRLSLSKLPVRRRLLAGAGHRGSTNPAPAERARGARRQRQPQVDAVAVVDMAARREQLHHGAHLDDAEADRALRLRPARALAAVPHQPVVHERGERRGGGAQRQELIFFF